MNENKWIYPKRDDLNRVERYQHYDSLYYGDHYKAFAIKAKEGFPEHYAKLRYVVANFPGLISRVIADMLFGERIVIDVKNANTQEWLDGLIDDNHLITQLYESSLANSRRGDSIFKIRGDNLHSPEKKVIIEEVSPAIYFPEFDRNTTRLTTKRDVLAWTYKSEDGKTTYLQKEIHDPGKIINELYTYDPSSHKILSQITEESLSEFGLEPEVETKVNHSLIFHVPNVRDGSGFHGTSDYKDLEQLFFALNNRITKVDNILDKHSDPILAVPPGVIDEQGKVRKERLGMFEVDNKDSGFNKPEYIVWNANLESAFTQIDKIVDFLFMFSEVAPATMGMDKEGQAESGRALKFKLLRTIAKRNRKKLYYDIMIKEMLQTAQEFGKAWGIKINGTSITNIEKPDIKWSDGVIPDMTEEIENEIKRLDAGLSSKPDSLSRLDGLKPEQAQKKVEEIEKENSISPIGRTPAQNQNTPEDN